MPVTVTGNFNTIIAGIEGRIANPGLITRLGEELAIIMASNSPVETGVMQDALSWVSEPERTATGWSIGVGNKKYLGDPDTPAPIGTIRAFLDDNPQYYILPRSNAKLAVGQMGAWGALPELAKIKLDEERLAGKYGGIGSAFARYMWVQNNGNGAAHIAGRMFLERSVQEWHSKVPAIVNDYLSEHSA